MVADRGDRRPRRTAPRRSTWTPPRRPSAARLDAGGAAARRRDDHVHRRHHRGAEDGPVDSRKHRRLGAGHRRRVRARPAGRDGRGDAALPRSRAARRAAGDPGCPAARCCCPRAGGSRRTRSGTTSTPSRATWYTAVPTIHQILLERDQDRPAGEQSCRVALHPQLQRPADPGNGAGAARHVLEHRWCVPSA